jgi:hypothetical protein
MTSSRSDSTPDNALERRTNRLNNKVAAMQRLWQLKVRAHTPWLMGFIVAFALGVGLGSRGHEPRLEALPAPPSMDQCMKDTVASLDLKQAPTTEVLEQVRGHCYALIQSQGLLRDYLVREIYFIQQYRANAVLMWMVVAVTFAGVALAALQLMASLQLASGKGTPVGDQQLIVKRDQIVLKSSVTGLFILLISFAFFLTYVIYVFRFQTPDDHSLRNVLSGPTLPMGQLGYPPQQLPKN